MQVASNAAKRVDLKLGEKGLRMIGQYASNGREAVNMVQSAAGLAITDERDYIKDEDIEWIIQSSQMTPRFSPSVGAESSIGVVNGLAVTGPNTGALLEIEVTVIEAQDKGTVTITGIVEEESFNSPGKSIRRKSMAKGSIENVVTVLRTMGIPADRYDIHVNFPGGIPIDGPSAGVAMAVGIYSAIYRIPVKNKVAMTGEISIHGKVKPVGGVFTKANAAKLAGAEMVIIPKENVQSILDELEGIIIKPVSQLKEVFQEAFDRTQIIDQIMEDMERTSERESG